MILGVALEKTPVGCADRSRPDAPYSVSQSDLVPEIVRAVRFLEKGTFSSTNPLRLTEVTA
jgi:hypothetical protein